MIRLKVCPHILFFTAFLGVVLSAVSLHAQALRVRVSVKFILDAEGNRPSEEGFIHTDLQVESHIAAANEALAANGADWRLGLVEIVDVAGFSGWYDQAPSPVPGPSSSASLEWRADAINVYVVNSMGGDWGFCRQATWRSVVLANDIWLKSTTHRDEMALLTSENPPEHLSYFIGTALWLHEICHCFILHHTQGPRCFNCTEGLEGLCHTVPGSDEVDDTIPDLQCWDPDDLAEFNFGVSYDAATTNEKRAVDLVWKNAMSYHNRGMFTDREAFLTQGQLERMAVEMDPDTGRRTAVLELVLFPEFTLGSETVEVSEEILLNAAGSRAEDGHALVSWEWDFGDGSTDKGESVTYAYTEAGLYTVQLTITDDRGLRTTLKKDVVVLTGDVDIAPWVSDDIGNTGFPGSARFEGTDLLVAAGGREFTGPTDNFHFVYQAVTGDTIITARVSELLPTDSVSQVGLMLRESLDPEGARHAGILLANSGSSHQIDFVRRERASTITSPSFDLPDTWLRLERRGNTFTGWHSENGIWRQRGSVTIDDMSETIYAGVAVTAINEKDNQTVLAKISDLTLAAPQPVNFVRGDGNGDGRMNIADVSYIAGLIFLDSVAPIHCEAAGDANGDGSVNIADPSYVANFLFGIGPAAAPPAPFPDCALVSPEEPLSCLGTSGCIE